MVVFGRLTLKVYVQDSRISILVKSDDFSSFTMLLMSTIKLVKIKINFYNKLRIHVQIKRLGLYRVYEPKRRNPNHVFGF